MDAFLRRQRAAALSFPAIATLWFCVGCSAPATVPALPSQAEGRLRASGPVLYVSDFLAGTVNVYRQRGRGQQPFAKIAGLQASLGLFVDDRRHFYVSQNAGILEFAPGGSVPVKSYDDPGHQPQGVTRCPNGTLYVTNVDGNTISVYEHGSTKPTKTLQDDGVQVFAIACDATNDVFVTVAGKKYQVDEFAADGSGPVSVPIQLDFPEGIAIDKSGDIVVANGSGGAVEFFHPGDTVPFRSIAMVHGSLQVAFNRADTILWVSTGSDVERYSVKTGKMTDALPIEAGGLAASPAD